ncbi:zinc ribbon domain-containing protein [Peptoniphilus sp. MSJ-1]|uniref:Zinc ribbon domain-containing protein n=1 Tax=Peptoniphilus ovalis TaxID=2841503 RepID=A0ABS6FEV8_9FIRM|nr:zinc ribbon domain-containing protein [Peptoniphilus ovalis]MBU5668712.1 zinc ribbon domain-containing protein [Peptoniphilus ovalis]
MFCIKCGNKLNENMKFCDQCGAPVPVRKSSNEHFTVDKTSKVAEKEIISDPITETKEEEITPSKILEDLDHEEAIEIPEAQKISETYEIKKESEIIKTEEKTEEFPKLELHEEIIEENHFENIEEETPKEKNYSHDKSFEEPIKDSKEEYFYESNRENKNYEYNSNSQSLSAVNIVAVVGMVLMGLLTIRTALVFISSFLWIIGGAI